MTIKTQAEAEEALRGLLTENHTAGPEAQAAAVIAHLRVLPPMIKAASREDQPKPAVLQLWRNRESNRLVKIISLGTGRLSSQIVWEAVDASRGPKNGRVFEHYWASRFDYVGMSE